MKNESRDLIYNPQTKAFLEMEKWFERKHLPPVVEYMFT